MPQTIRARCFDEFPAEDADFQSLNRELHRRMHILLPFEESDDAGLFIVHETMLPGAWSPAHSHDWEQMFYTIRGEIRVVLDGKSVTCGPDTWLRVAPGVMHEARHQGMQPAERLVITHHTRKDHSGRSSSLA